MEALIRLSMIYVLVRDQEMNKLWDLSIIFAGISLNALSIWQLVSLAWDFAETYLVIHASFRITLIIAAIEYAKNVINQTSKLSMKQRLCTLIATSLQLMFMELKTTFTLKSLKSKIISDSISEVEPIQFGMTELTH